MSRRFIPTNAFVIGAIRTTMVSKSKKSSGSRICEEYALKKQSKKF